MILYRVYDLTNKKLKGAELMINGYEGILDQLRAQEKAM